MRGKLRLYSGLILFTYVTGHLVSHAFGIVSLNAMNGTLAYAAQVWWNPVGQVALFGALAVHLGCALFAIYRRDSLRMRRWQAAQLVLGLLIPLVLAGHIVGTRILYLTYGVASDYTFVLSVLWVAYPILGLLQAVLLVAAWSHGCIGIYGWQMTKPWFGRHAPVLLALAAVLPALSLAGYLAAGLEVQAMLSDAQALAGMLASKKLSPEAVDFEFTLIPIVLGIYLLAVGGAFVSRAWRLSRRKDRVRVTYPGGRSHVMPAGATVLGTSLANGIPHASVCGGRGRCSTCRVQTGQGAEYLTPASPDEEKVLRRVGAPPGVRLACQLKPTRDLQVTPLLPVSANVTDGFGRADYVSGQEREIAILFADLRGFTSLSERKLPYDVVFLLNRYFAVMGEAIESAGGRLDKFIGDGVMALFGVESGADEGCRRALRAAAAMAEALEVMNDGLAGDLEEPLRMGIGIHIGPSIVGEMGYGAAKGLTAVGDAVNTASRLEAMTKTFSAQLVISAEVARRAGLGEAGFERKDAEIRGKREALPILVLQSAVGLADRLH